MWPWKADLWSNSLAWMWQISAHKKTKKKLELCMAKVHLNTTWFRIILKQNKRRSRKTAHTCMQKLFTGPYLWRYFRKTFFNENKAADAHMTEWFYAKEAVKGHNLLYFCEKEAVKGHNLLYFSFRRKIKQTLKLCSEIVMKYWWFLWHLECSSTTINLQTC